MGRSPGLSPRGRSLLRVCPPNDVVFAIQQRNYSCATAHVFHVIPSWQPRYRAEPGDVLLFQRSDVLNVSVFGKYDNPDAKIRFFFVN